ncbi:MAG: GNAT family N-acetyltransferase [Candidatus Xenobium sp.]|jgi:ribosomal protein S18 acetylase RimI-like enzyme
MMGDEALLRARAESRGLEETVDHQLRDYGECRLADIRANSVEDWPLAGATHVRVRLPATVPNQVQMQARGYLLADRTLGASIPLKRAKVDFQALIRLPACRSEGHIEEIYEIARSSFPVDRRFHLAPLCDDPRLFERILREWTRVLEAPFVCKIGGEVAGFLALTGLEEKKPFVHLAAVAERFRMSGAALSLYATAAASCQEAGFATLTGRISTSNLPALNLYASLGASFSDPIDIFLRREEP